MTIHHQPCDWTGRNTTTATADRIVKFKAGTSPGSMFIRAGVIAKDQQMPFYTAVVTDVLRKDIARRNGEYLSSLATLLNIPEDRWRAFNQASQEQFPTPPPLQMIVKPWRFFGRRPCADP